MQAPNEAKIQKRKELFEKRRERAAKIAERLGAVKLIFEKEKIKHLKGADLTLHLQAYKLAGAPNLQGVTSRSRVDDKRQALPAAIDSFNAGEWEPLTHSRDGTSSEEE